MICARLTTVNPASARPTFERRSFPRRRARGTAVCRWVARPFSLGSWARLVDISPDGIGLLTTEHFPPGMKIEIELIPPSGQPRLFRTAEVRWTAPAANGEQRIGCRWERRLPFIEIQCFF